VDTRIELEAKTDRELLMLAVERLNTVCAQVQLQNGRVRSLEDWRNVMVGGLTLLCLMVTLLGGWLLSKV
jgi:hypothetical protein